MLRVALARLAPELARNTPAIAGELRVFLGARQKENFPPGVCCDLSKISDGAIARRVPDSLPGEIKQKLFEAFGVDDRQFPAAAATPP